MRIIASAVAIWRGLTAPSRVQEATTQTAAAIFAVAVLVVGLVSAVCAISEGAHQGLAWEQRLLSPTTEAPSTEGVEIESPQRVFTAALGGALMVTIVSTAVLAGILLVLVRFMTDAPVTFGMAIVSVSATALIQVIDLVISTGGHLLFGTTQAGLHAGVFMQPADGPFLFAWLQRLSVLSLWQYLAAAVALVSWGGLHSRFGIVVGLTVWVVTRLVLGLSTLVLWILSLK